MTRLSQSAAHFFVVCTTNKRNNISNNIFSAHTIYSSGFDTDSKTSVLTSVMRSRRAASLFVSKSLPVAVRGSKASHAESELYHCVSEGVTSFVNEGSTKRQVGVLVLVCTCL